MNAPRVGIAIPAYRSEKTLRAALESCVRQDTSDWIAFVTVDGAVADAERAIVHELGDERIRLEVNGARKGQYGNFNRAILRCYAAGATWTKLLSADDVLRPDALSRMVEVGESSAHCGLVFGYYDTIDETGRQTGAVDLSGVCTGVFPGGEVLRRALRFYNPIGGPSSVMFRTEFIEHAGLFDDAFGWSGDALLWYRFLKRYEAGIIGDRPILDYRQHQNSVTGRAAVSAARFQDSLRILRGLANQSAPMSRDWLLAQEAIGETFASNLLTSAALARRGRVRDGLRGAVASASCLGASSLLPALWASGKVALSCLGIMKRMADDPLGPPLRRVPEEKVT